MSRGVIFDIKEFSVGDGPGIRVTVHLKGCPLRCKWCHNPEGMQQAPQVNKTSGRTVGEYYEAEELARELQKYESFFKKGGITFSGGEPTAQAQFLKEVCGLLPGVHKTLDTSGYCEPETFAKLTDCFDLFYFDLKLAEESEHVKYTGVSNGYILKNLETLAQKKKDIVIRLPMIPHITDTKENLDGIANIICGLKDANILSIDILPYNELAEGKYSAYGMEYPLAGWYRKNDTNAIDEFAERMKNAGFKINDYRK